MTNASEICAAVQEVLAAGRTVYITDLTETRKVNGVEFLATTSYRSFDDQVLIVTVDYGDGESKPWEITVAWPWNELDGWALKDVNGVLFIAPNFFFSG